MPSKTNLERYFYILAFLLFLLVYLTTADGYFFIPDAEASYKTATSLVEDGTVGLEVTSFRDLRFVANAVGSRRKLTIYFRGDDGKVYSKTGPGTAFYMIPFIFLGKLLYFIIGTSGGAARDFFQRFSISFMNSFSMAFGCILLMKCARRMNFSFRISFILALFLGLGTSAWYYANSTFPEALLMTELLGAIYFIFKAQETKKYQDIAISAVFVGLLVITKYATVIVLPLFLIFAVYISLREKNIRFTVIFISIVMGFILPYFWFRFQVFGDALRGGYVWELEKVISPKRPLYLTLIKGLHYITFSSYKGLFVYSPLLILSLFSLPRFFKKERRLFLLLFSISILYIYIVVVSIAVASFTLRLSWGPRYLVLILPCLILPMGYLLQGRKKKIYITVIALVFIVSFFINIVSVIIPMEQYFFIKSKFTKFKVAQERTLYLPEGRPQMSPPDIKGAFILLKHKLFKKDEIYSSQDFGIHHPIKRDIVIMPQDSLRHNEYKGFGLWYLYLQRKVGTKITKAFPFVSIPVVLILAFMLFQLTGELDSPDPHPRSSLFSIKKGILTRGT